MSNPYLARLSARSRFLWGVIALGASVLATARVANAQTFYVSDPGDGTIKKVSSTGVISTFATGISGAEGLVFDSSGNLYVTSYTANTISKITSGGVVSTFVSGLNQPYGLTTDANGNFYVANASNNTVSKITSSGVVSTFASTGLNAPFGVALDANGNLFVSNNNSRTISKIATDGTVSSFASLGSLTPEGLAFDGSGNLYVAAIGGGTFAIDRITSGGVVSTFSNYSGLNYPSGLAFDTVGNLYAANYGLSNGNNVLNKITSTGAGSAFATGLTRPTFVTMQIAGSAAPEPGTQSLTLVGMTALMAGEFLSRRKRPARRP